MVRAEYRVLVTLAALALGVLAGVNLALPFTPAFELVVEGLLGVVPPLVFATVAASIASADGTGTRGVLWKIAWYVGVAYLAAIVGALFIAVAIDAPLATAPSRSMTWTSTIPVSGVIIAVLAAIPIGFVARYHPVLNIVTTWLDQGAERLLGIWGKGYPVFAFLGGASIVDATGAVTGTLEVYLVLCALTVVGSVLWQLGWLALARALTDIDLWAFLRYYLDVIGIPVATASEAIAIPYNVQSGARHLDLDTETDVQFEFVLGGSLNTPGSVMNGVIFAGAVPHLLYGYTPSLGTLLVIGFVSATVLSASPGVPGELALVLPAIEVLLPVTGAGFAAAWLSLQVGIPDAVRSTVNVTDDGIYVHFFERFESAPDDDTPQRDSLDPLYPP